MHLIQYVDQLQNDRSEASALALVNDCSLQGLSFIDGENTQYVKQALNLLPQHMIGPFCAKLTSSQINQLAFQYTSFHNILMLMKESQTAYYRFIESLNESTTEGWFFETLSEEQGFLNLLSHLNQHNYLLVSHLALKLSKFFLAEGINSLENLGRYLMVPNYELQKAVIETASIHLSIHLLRLNSKPLREQKFAWAVINLRPELRNTLLSLYGRECCLSLLELSRQQQFTYLTEALLSYLVPASWTLERCRYSTSMVSMNRDTQSDEDIKFTLGELEEIQKNRKLGGDNLFTDKELDELYRKSSPTTGPGFFLKPTVSYDDLDLIKEEALTLSASWL